MSQKLNQRLKRVEATHVVAVDDSRIDRTGQRRRRIGTRRYWINRAGIAMNGLPGLIHFVGTGRLVGDKEHALNFVFSDRLQ